MIRANAQVWRAELTIGTRHGYEGPEMVKPGDLLPLIDAFQRQSEPWYAVIVWTRGTVTGPTFPAETVIKVTLESNPLYTPNASESAIVSYAAGLAAFLGAHLHQVRVYVAVYPIRSLIIEQMAE